MTLDTNDPRCIPCADMPLCAQASHGLCWARLVMFGLSLSSLPRLGLKDGGVEQQAHTNASMNLLWKVHFHAWADKAAV